MRHPVEHVMDITFGRWRSQIVYAGVELGVFDMIGTSEPMAADTAAAAIEADPALLFRLLRALASLGLLEEFESGEFVVTPAGALLKDDHPDSLRYMVLLEEGPEHYALWKHLTAMVRDGKQNAFVREYGQMAFDYARNHPPYGDVFKAAMSSFSSVQSSLALEAMAGIDFSRTAVMCDIAGGQGHLLCSLLCKHPYLKGIVFDLPEVISNTAALWAPRMGVADRCRYEGGNMFVDVPTADAYCLKMILHDWNDAECVQILGNIRRRTAPGTRLFVVEHVIPGPGDPHFSKLYDIHMMCWGSGCERTEAEYRALFERAGWAGVAAHYPASRAMGVMEGVAV